MALFAVVALAGCAAQDEPRAQTTLPLDQPAPLDGGDDALDYGPIDHDEPEDDNPDDDEQEELVEPAEGFEEILMRLEQLPGELEALVVEDGEVLLHTGTDTPAPLASVAKVYVLRALVDDIDAGNTDWNDQMALTEELRSLPSGSLQDQAEGYTTTVYDVAHRMMSISDNTGTDMLMDLLGREAVEQAVAEAGHHDPELMQPFLTTRELFQLRWGVPELGEDWGERTEGERREVLDDLSGEDLEIGYADTSPHDLDFAIDWYATAEDIAEVHIDLAERAAEHSELEEIISANPGLVDTVENEWWEMLSFKGGGLPGVVTGTWHAVGEDGHARTVVVLLRTEDTEDISEHRDELFSLALDALIAGTDTERENGDA